MKHLKLFENQSDTVSVAIYIPTQNTDNYIRDNTTAYIFEKPEDMENFILDYVNSDLSTWDNPPDLDGWGYRHETDEDGHDFFIDFQDAMAWLSDPDFNPEYRFIVQVSNIIKNVQVPDNVRFYRDTNKYNL